MWRPNWDAESGGRIGRPIWETEFGGRFGRPNWEPEMGDRNGGSGCRIRRPDREAEFGDRDAEFGDPILRPNEEAEFGGRIRKKDPDDESGCRIRGQNSETASGGRIRRQDPGAGFGCTIRRPNTGTESRRRIRRQNSGAGFGCKIRRPNSATESGRRIRRQNSVGNCRRHKLEAEFGGRVLNDGGRSVGGWDVISDMIQMSSGTAYFPARSLSKSQNQFWASCIIDCIHPFPSFLISQLGWHYYVVAEAIPYLLWSNTMHSFDAIRCAWSKFDKFPYHNLIILD